MLKLQLAFLQKIVIKTEMRRKVSFWKKQAVLRIFAKWCEMNSGKINFTKTWQCLTDEMSLFDVVYLDIVHEFRVPINVLLEYARKEGSVELIGKLAFCYSNDMLMLWKTKNTTGYKFHIKTRQMIQYVLQYKYISSDFIFSYVNVLMNCNEFDMASLVLTSVMVEIDSSTDFKLQKWPFSDTFHSQKTRNEIQEISDILEIRKKDQHFNLFLPLVCHFLSILCYRYTGDETNLNHLLGIVKIDSFIEYMSSWKDSMEMITYTVKSNYVFCLSMLESLEHLKEWENCFCVIYKMFISMKISLIHKIYEERLNKFNQRKSTILYPYQFSFCSCHPRMSQSLNHLAGILKLADQIELGDAILTLSYSVVHAMQTTADKTYYSQFFIYMKECEPAVSLLEEIVEQEGDYSLSVVILSKPFSNLLDETLSNELAKCSTDYIVFPTNLYARYLLGIAYNSLGQEERYKSNMTELIILRQRYSAFPEWAPMLNIMDNII